MKVKNFKINVVVDDYWKKSLITVEEDFTIRQLRKEMDLPEGYSFLVDWIRATDDSILEDWDLVELHYDTLTLVDRLQKEVRELREIIKDLHLN